MPARRRKDSIADHHIDDADFCVVDVETTGLSTSGGDRVCEVGAVMLRGGAVVETFGSLIDPRRPVSPGAYAVNRISPQMLADAPEFTAIAPRLKEMMDESIIVAYNAPFDVSFLTMEFRLAGLPAIQRPIVDALVIARQLIPGLTTYQQDHVARTAGIRSGVSHRALEDALTTAQLFLIFTSVLKAHDCNLCSDLQRRDLKLVLHEQRMRLVGEALSGRHYLWLRYLSPLSGEIEDSMVTPKGWADGKSGRDTALYLVAHCHRNDAVRDFRIDRILDMRVVRE